MIFRRIFTPVFILVLASSCSNSGQYGTKFNSQSSVSVEEGLQLFLSKGSAEQVISGKIGNVCQSEGCWFEYNTDSGVVFVDFQHKFEIPKNASGKTAVAKGSFGRDTTTVDQLKEYAKDDGKSETEINAIVKPEVRIVFTATGVNIVEAKKP